MRAPPIRWSRARRRPTRRCVPPFRSCCATGATASGGWPKKCCPGLRRAAPHRRGPVPPRAARPHPAGDRPGARGLPAADRAERGAVAEPQPLLRGGGLHDAPHPGRPRPRAPAPEARRRMAEGGALRGRRDRGAGPARHPRHRRRARAALGARPAQGHHRRAAFLRRAQHRRDRRLPATWRRSPCRATGGGPRPGSTTSWPAIRSRAPRKAKRTARTRRAWRPHASEIPGTPAWRTPPTPPGRSLAPGGCSRCSAKGPAAGCCWPAAATLDDGRRVAIKTLHSPSRAALARFELERQALARLEHPNIARLYDAGKSAAGVPYVVLEHVAGLPIDDYCEQQDLGVEERLRPFPRGLPRGPARPPQPDRAPRPQAGQHPGGRRRPAAAARFRHRPPAGLGDGDGDGRLAPFPRRASAHRAGAGRLRRGHHPGGRSGRPHPGLRQPRADPRQADHHRFRRLQPGHRALRAARRPFALGRQNLPPRAGAGDLRAGCRAASAGPPGGAAIRGGRGGSPARSTRSF